VWLEQIQLAGLGDDDDIWQRYVGTCANPTTPRDRMLEDHESKRGLHGDILVGLAEVYPPSPVPKERSFYVPTAQLPPNAAQAEVDMRERILIALPHLPSLNRQSGGLYQM
jgi:hypothetical protein